MRILVADSGSTKTDWRAVLTSGEVVSFRSIGFNPFFVTQEQITSEIEKSIPEHFLPGQVEQVYFYGAGCSAADRNKTVEDGIRKVFPKARVIVNHDLLGAARALFGREEGIAAILGTGSNTCLYNGSEIIANVASLGYILGDEGSGAYLGKEFIRALLNKRLSQETTAKFQSEYGLTRDDVLTAVYKKPFPNKFLASFAYFLRNHAEQHDIRELILNSFLAFFDNQICRYDGYQSYRIRTVGSIAWNFRDFIEEAAGMRGTHMDQVLEYPVDALVRYHLEG